MVTQAEIIEQLDMLKNKDRSYRLPGGYKEFLPYGLPRTTELPDNSILEQGMHQATNYSKGANELMMIQAQNERDYQEMVRAKKAMEQAKKNLKRAERLQALNAQYSGTPGKVKITRTNTAVSSPNNKMSTSQGGSVNVPPGNFKDKTPFNINAGLGSYKWKGFGLTVNKSLANNFVGFLNALAKTGYKVTSLGSYANRNIAGTSTRSLHSYGLAIDINPSANPVAYNKVISNLPPGVGRLAAKYGLAWGGEWNGSKKDPMHFSKPWYGTK